MFDEYHKLEAMDYTVRQIRAMVAEGTSVEDALRSMAVEICSRRAGLKQRLQGTVQMLDVLNEQDNELI